MSSHRISRAYLAHAPSLDHNERQRAAYDSAGHCVVLAGPGSGKTKTLTLKLARILAEDVRAPRGVACITYSQECARELTRRLEALGLRGGPNLFIGTVHGFCLRHLLMPYAQIAGLDLPYPLKMATTAQSDAIIRRAGQAQFGAHNHKAGDMGKHRRSVLDRDGAAWRFNTVFTPWAERSEAMLRADGLIDYDDLVVQGRKLVVEHDWVLPLIRAKFPVLVVDEYQDLGVALHDIVERLAFDGGVRLLAVGDSDQSVYGFNGANGALLQDLADRPEVERVQLELNYRSADAIIRASELVLGEARGYRARDPDRQATIAFRTCPNGVAEQAAYAVNTLVTQALADKPGRRLGDIAILYRHVDIGSQVADAAAAAGHLFVRVDSAAPYKKCALTSWIEDCAGWCAGGWTQAKPTLASLVDRWIGFHDRRFRDKDRRLEGRRLARFLWSQRQDGAPARAFVEALRRELLDPLLAATPSLGDQADQVEKMTTALGVGEPMDGLEMRNLGRQDGSPDHLNLMTVHSSKGCEFDVVIMVGLDNGIFPWMNEAPDVLAQSRQLFYVGLTRARDAVHLVSSGWVRDRYGRRWNDGRSIFVEELETSLQEEDDEFEF